MRKLNDTNRTRKRSVRHSWIKAGPGIQRCAICGITKRSEYIDGKTVHCVHLSSGELYSMTGETPECLYDRRDTRMQGFKRVLLIKNMRYGNVV